ncbi:hypothetical protein C8R45DRAFT_1089296 [Mycena sanguinolenta]|nr:hypothetical protein C8R45DRAFT_1089296 [Mycena sanguinolenta]
MSSLNFESESDSSLHHDHKEYTNNLLLESRANGLDGIRDDCVSSPHPECATGTKPAQFDIKTASNGSTSFQTFATCPWFPLPFGCLLAVLIVSRGSTDIALLRSFDSKPHLYQQARAHVFGDLNGARESRSSLGARDPHTRSDDLIPFRPTVTDTEYANDARRFVSACLADKKNEPSDGAQSFQRGFAPQSWHPGLLLPTSGGRLTPPRVRLNTYPEDIQFPTARRPGRLIEGWICRSTEFRCSRAALHAVALIGVAVVVAPSVGVLRALLPVLDGCDVAYVSTRNSRMAAYIGGNSFPLPYLGLTMAGKADSGGRRVEGDPEARSGVDYRCLQSRHQGESAIWIRRDGPNAATQILTPSWSYGVVEACAARTCSIVTDGENAPREDRRQRRRWHLVFGTPPRRRAGSLDMVLERDSGPSLIPGGRRIPRLVLTGETYTRTNIYSLLRLHVAHPSNRYLVITVPLARAHVSKSENTILRGEDMYPAVQVGLWDACSVGGDPFSRPYPGLEPRDGLTPSTQEARSYGLVGSSSGISKAKARYGFVKMDPTLRHAPHPVLELRKAAVGAGVESCCIHEKTPLELAIIELRLARPFHGSATPSKLCFKLGVVRSDCVVSSAFEDSFFLPARRVRVH